MLDIRQRTGYLFLAVMVGHVILISAQVPTKSGVPVLEGVTFGAFSRVQGRYRGHRRRRSEQLGQLRGAARSAASRMRRCTSRWQTSRSGCRSSGRWRRGRCGCQELIDLKTNTSLPTIAAEIIAGNPNPGMLTVTIDRGSADGVQANMAVISPRGIVGRVVGNPASHASRVQLLVDRSAAAGALGRAFASGRHGRGD